MANPMADESRRFVGSDEKNPERQWLFENQPIGNKGQPLLQ